MGYAHLGPFSDFVDAARGLRPLPPVALPGPATQSRVREALAFSLGDERPLDVQTERCWEDDGLLGEEVSWWVGYGPRTHAWLLRPASSRGPLPGVVALHDHGGFKYSGKEKVAAGPDPVSPVLAAFHAQYYGGRAWANALAHEGFAVLIPDTFLWGSRRFPLEVMPDNARDIGAWLGQQAAESVPADIAAYNASAGQHEHLVEKYCRVLGTTLSGVISYEDRVALNYLAGRPEVKADRLGCAGLSGGGLRSALLQATCDRVAAAVIVGMMCTYDGLLDHNVASHTWMLFPAAWPTYGDWPDLAACRAPSPLLVQYDLDDQLFTPEGMRAADRRLAGHYAAVGQPANYTGQFYPGLHKFDLEMQAAAFAWLKEHLA